MKRPSDEELARLSLPELIELVIDIMEEIKLQLMENAGEEDEIKDGKYNDR